MLSDGQRLRKIRETYGALPSRDWMRATDGDRNFIEARGQMGERVRLLVFDPAATLDEQDFIADAAEIIAFLLKLLDRAIEKARPTRDDAATAAPARSEREAKDFAAEAAMKCAEPAFKAFLRERHGLDAPLTDERVAQKVRSLLGVTSRKELNQGGRAAQAWRELRASFDAWRRAGR